MATQPVTMTLVANSSSKVQLPGLRDHKHLLPYAGHHPLGLRLLTKLLGPLPAIRETSMELLALAFFLSQTQLLQPFGG